MKRYYFDFAASTPVNPAVLRAMSPFFSDKFGNPGSLHSFGQDAVSAVDGARETLAKALGAKHDQIIFTSSATEANNLAIKGAYFKAKDPARFKKPKIIVSTIEHESVLESARDLKNFGAEVVYLPVNKEGRVDIKKFRKELDSSIILVSVMLGNNEIGTIQPLTEISEIISQFKQRTALRSGAAPRTSGHGATRGGASEDEAPAKTHAGSLSGSREGEVSPYPLLHSDAAQAFPYMEVNVDRLGVDLLTVSSQKIYGPKGAGALYIKDKRLIDPIISGGSQEYGLRSGTENVPAIVGFGEAVEINERVKKSEVERLSGLRRYFLERTKKVIPHVEINGIHEEKVSLPHIINLYFPGERAEELMAKLDISGFAVSAGSACRARSAEPSYVLLAMGHGKQRALGSLRISFGRSTKKDDIDKLIQKLKK
jgi:cysteine desulfurase